MTKECAIDLYKAIDIYLCAGNSIWDVKKIHDAMSMAIEALLAKDINVPSNGDVISRQDVLDLIEHYNSDALGTVFIDWKHGKKFEGEIKSLPSAQKIGRWMKRESWKDVPTVCSECKREFTEYVNGYEWEETGDLPNYCPNCGASMRGEEV